ncbi:MAG: NUDIX domain-containing protein [Rhodothermales bacterium]
MSELVEKHVVTCFLRHKSEILLLRRSPKVGTYPGRWGAVSGYVEESPDETAYREIEEETGIKQAIHLARRGTPFSVEDASLGTRWMVHPYLFDVSHRDLRLDWETTDVAWVPAPEILRRDTVPQLWTSYVQVAPSPASIEADRQNGSGTLSYRALEVLRDRAGWMAHQGKGTSAGWEDLRVLAERLVEARASMAALRNRVNRAMHACRNAESAGALEREVQTVLEKALADDEETARQAANYVTGRRIFTLSRSGTVLEALRLADPVPSAIIIAESRPGGEGVEVAEELASQGVSVTLICDAAIGSMLAEKMVDVVIVGADTVLPNGDVVNKVGTRLAAMAARQHHIPFYVAASTDKVSTEKEPHLKHGTLDDLYGGMAPLEVYNPIFDVTPAKYLSGIITEEGVLASIEMQDVAFERKALEGW